MSALEEHLIVGSILASLIVLLFIRNIPATIISSLAIPASLIASFTLMRALNLTLNTMTLLGLTLAVGIVIDDAIVVLENIFRKIDEEGLTPFRAAMEGTSEVLLAVAATSFSLIVIFLPVAFMTGYAQRFIYPFGITMSFAIMVSFLVSVTLTPMLGARMLRRNVHGHRARDERVLPLARCDVRAERSLVARPPRRRHGDRHPDDGRHMAARELRRALVHAAGRHRRLRDDGRRARGHLARRAWRRSCCRWRSWSKRCPASRT